MPIENELQFETSQAIRNLDLLTKEIKEYSSGLRGAKTDTNTFNAAFNKLADEIGRSVAQYKKVNAVLDANTKARNANYNATLANAKAERIRNNLTKRTGVDSGQFFNQRDLGKGSIEQVIQFDKAAAAFQKVVAATGTGEKRINQILNKLVGDYRGADAEIRAALVNLLKAQEALGGEPGRKASELLGRLPGQIDKTKSASEKLLLSWQSVTRIFVSQAIFRAITGISRQLSDSVRLSRDLEKSLAEVRTIAPKDLGVDKLRGFTTEISNTFGIDQVEVARATYEAFSNQVGDTADVFQFLEASATFAKATLTDLADTQDLLSGVLNAYGLEANNARRVSDQLFKTIDLGRVRGEEIANTYGRLLPLAEQLGVSFGEINAALATTTIQGVGADTALTQIQNILKGLIKPTDALKQRFQDLGLSGAEAGIARFGLIGFLKEITEGANSVQDLSAFFDDIRELRGVLGVLAQEGKLFETSLRGITEQADNAAAAAADIVLNTETEKLERAQQVIKNLFAQEFGNRVVIGLNNMIELLGGAKSAADILISVLLGGFAATATIIGIQLVQGLRASTVQMIGLSAVTKGAAASMTALQVASGVFIAFAAGVQLALWISRLQEANSLQKKLANNLEITQKRAQDAFAELSRADSKSQREFEKGIDSLGSDLIKGLQNRLIKTREVEEDAIRAERNITQNLKKQIGERASAIRSFIGEVEKSISESRGKVDELLTDNRDFKFRLNKDQFSRNLRGAEDNPAQQARLLEQRINELRSASQKAFGVGQTDFAKRLNDEAFNIATQLAELTGKRSQGESALNQIVKDREGINAKLILQEEKKAQAAERELQALENQAAALDRLISKFDELIDKLTGDNVSQTARDDFQNQLVEVGKEIQEQINSFGDGALVGFDKQLAEIQKSFRDFDGNKVQLDFLIDQSLETVDQTLKQARFSAVLELQIEDELGILAGKNQVRNFQTRIAELTKQLKTAKANALPLETQINVSGELQGTAFKSLNDFANAITEKQQRIRANINELETNATLAGVSFDFEKKFKVQLLALESLGSAVDFMTDKIGSGELERAILNINQIITSPLGEKAGINNLNASLGTLRKTIEELQKSDDKIETFADFQKDVDNGSIELAKMLSLLQQDELANPKINITINSAEILQQIQGLADAYQTLQNRINQPAAQPQGRQRGGLIYRADGGFVPRGTDTIPAMLSPNEFVVNAKSTRKFYSQLVAINKGQQPVYRQDGGTTSNTTIGDINVTVNEAGAVPDARRLTGEIRRELRRNSSRL